MMHGQKNIKYVQKLVVLSCVERIHWTVSTL